MPSPLGHVDAASFFGSWPLTPYFSGTTPEVLPGALLDRATLLSARRETSAGFNVSGRSFKIWIDAVGPITVTFTGTNPLDLDDVISQINSGVLGGYGQDVAFRDNGFLRLRSNTIGGTSYLKIDTDPASSPADVFLELGLFAGLESQGGSLTTSPTVDPDRQVALPGQYSVGYGEDLDYNAINRAVCQLAVNADHAYGQFRRGMAKTTTADLAISSDEVQITGENVYCGKVTAGTAQDDTAVVLDTSDNEVVVERDTDTHTSLALDFYYNVEEQKQYVEATAVTPFTATDPEGDYYVVVTTGGSFGALEKMKIIEFVSTSIVVVANIVEADGSEVEVGTPSSPVSITDGIRRRTDTERLYVTDFLDGAGGSSVIDTAVEIVAATTISRVEWNNRLVCDSATFAANGVKEGDVAVIASHDTSVPFSNNGSYRVSQVVDEKTIELMSLDHGPVILNTLGTLGTVTIQTDTNFFYQPYAKLSFAPPSGTYRVVFKKYVSLLEMVDDIDSFATSPTRFVQETSTDIQKVVKAIIGPSATSFNEYLYNDKRNSLENLYFRLNQEHNEDGHHPYLTITDTMPEAGWIGTKLTIQDDVVDPTGTALGTGTVNADVLSLVEDKNAWAFQVRGWNRDTVGTYQTGWLGGIWAQSGLTGSGRAVDTDAISASMFVEDSADVTGWACTFRAYTGTVTGHVENYAGLRVDDLSSVGADQSYGVYIEGAATRSILVVSGTSEYRGRVNIFEGTTTEGHADAVLDAQKWHSNPASNHTAVVVTNNVTASPNNRNAIGLYGGSEHHSSTGTTGYQVGLYGGSYTGDGSGGTVLHAHAFAGDAANTAASGATIDNAVVFHAWDGAVGGGAINNYYGLYVRDLDAGSTANYGAYFEGATTAAIQVQAGKVNFWTDGAAGDSGWNGDHSEFVDTTPATGDRYSHLFEVDVVNRTGGGDVGNIIASTNSYAAAGTYNWNPVVWSEYSTRAGSSTATINSVECFGGQFNHLGAEDVTWAMVYRAYGGPAPTGSGDFDNYAGLYVDNLTRADNNYGVYIAGASPGYAVYVNSGDSYFGGNITARHLYPGVTQTYDLGSDSLAWRRLWISAGNTPGDIVVGGRTYKSGIWAQHSSGRDTITISPVNDFLPDTTVTSAVAVIHPYADSANNDSTQWAAFRVSHGATLVDSFHVSIRGQVYAAGPVGIGTTGPFGAQLDVVGDIASSTGFTGRSTASHITVAGGSTTSDGARILLYGSAATSYAGDVWYRANEHNWNDLSGTRCAYLNSTGMIVGVGTTASYKLDVEGSVRLGTGVDGAYITTPSYANSLNFGRTGVNYIAAAGSGGSFVIRTDGSTDTLTLTSTATKVHGTFVSLGAAGVGIDGNLDSSQLNVHGLGAKLLISSSSETVDAVLKLADSESLVEQQFSIVYDCSSPAPGARAMLYIGNAVRWSMFRQEDANNMSFSPGAHGWNWVGKSDLRWAGMYAYKFYFSSVAADDDPAVYANASNSYLVFDSGDYIRFDRTGATANDLHFYINSGVQLLYDSSADYWRFYAHAVPDSSSHMLGSTTLRWGNVYAQKTSTYDSAQAPASQAELLTRNQQNLIVARVRINVTTPTSPSISGDHWNVASVTRLTEGSFEVTLDQAVDTNCQVVVNPDIGVVNGITYLAKASLTASNKVVIHTYRFGQGGTTGTISTTGGAAYISLDDGAIDYLDLVVIGRPNTLQ